MSDYQEFDLNDELMDDFASKLEFAINMVLQDHPDTDCRIELMSTLLSFASQVAQDLGIDDADFKDLADQFYNNSAEEEPFDVSQSN